jgi:hypothetical protein
VAAANDIRISGKEANYGVVPAGYFIQLGLAW